MAKNKLETKTIEEEYNIPKTEKVCEQYSNNGVLTYIKTHNVPLRNTYYLYTIINGKAEKTKYKSDNPTDLNKWIK